MNCCPLDSSPSWLVGDDRGEGDLKGNPPLFFLRIKKRNKSISLEGSPEGGGVKAVWNRAG
jgi:hypothetical protein